MAAQGTGHGAASLGAHEDTIVIKAERLRGSRSTPRRGRHGSRPGCWRWSWGRLPSGRAFARRARAAIDQLAVYEAPFIVDDSRPPAPSTYVPELNAVLADGRRGDAVKLFMRLVGMPRILVSLFPLFPGWKKLRGSHTLPYDAACMGDIRPG
jgi:hypothetical protein